MYSLHAIPHQKLMIVLVCITLLCLLLSFPYETQRAQQERHDLHIAMMKLALKQHTYYVDHYTYTHDISVFNEVTQGEEVSHTPYDVFLDKNMDYRHDFVIIAQYKNQKDTQKEEVLCPYITLNQAGRWCVKGQCAAKCWTE